MVQLVILGDKLPALVITQDARAIHRLARPLPLPTLEVTPVFRVVVETAHLTPFEAAPARLAVGRHLGTGLFGFVKAFVLLKPSSAPFHSELVACALRVGHATFLLAGLHPLVVKGKIPLPHRPPARLAAFFPGGVVRSALHLAVLLGLRTVTAQLTPFKVTALFLAGNGPLFVSLGVGPIESAPATVTAGVGGVRTRVCRPRFAGERA